MKEEGRSKGTSPLLTHICKYCNKEFLAKLSSRRQQYCGRICRSNAAKRTDIRKKTLCIMCKNEFSHYGEKVLCSGKCQSTYLSQMRLINNDPRCYNPEEQIFKKCKNCGDKFKHTKGEIYNEKKMCSLWCASNIRRGENKNDGPSKFLNSMGQEFKKMKKYIKERDNFTCVLCGQSDIRLSVYHVDYDKNNNQEENLITLCHRCYTVTNSERVFWQMVFSALLSSSKLVRKGWGIESWITNNENYCLKYLIFFKGKEFSFHSHEIKKELWHCLLGKFECVLQNDLGEKDYCVFKKGSKIEIDPKTAHQLRAIENSIIVEVSTQHFDEDSNRIVKGD